MYKTLGGERLGAGKKMKVELHNYERSTQDLGYTWKNTQAPGTLVPFMNILGLPGDTFDINLNADVKTVPTVGPLFGSMKLQLDVFTCPIRLYHKWLHNNKLGVGMDMSKIKFPLVTLKGLKIDPTSDIPPEFQQINQSCLLAYLGQRGIAGNMDVAGTSQTKNALSILAYWDIFKNYFANKMESNAYVIHAATMTVSNAKIVVGETITDLMPTPSGPSDTVVDGSYIEVSGTNLNAYFNIDITIGSSQLNVSLAAYSKEIWISDDKTAAKFYLKTFGEALQYTVNAMFIDQRAAQMEAIPSLLSFPLENIDTMRDNILAASGATAYNINATTLLPYTAMTDVVSDTYKMYAVYPQEGLAVKTYQSDIFNNWVSTDTIAGVNGISAVTAISTAGGSFTIDTLNISKKVYDMLNRIAVSGGSYEDWLEAVYSHESYWRAETPVYQGGLSKEIVFQEVINTAKSDDNPLGYLGGRGILSNKHKGGYLVIKVDEPCILMGIVSITPRIDYSQGNDWTTNLKTLDDLHKPALDQIGFQSLVTEQMAFWDSTVASGNIVRYSAGYQPAWLNYMTNYNKTFGNFADTRNQMYMTLNRRYKINSTTRRITDLTTYIDPSKFNYAFAQTDLTAMNFMLQIACDIEARRKISAKLIPNL